jgi:hypothetical protein
MWTIFCSHLHVPSFQSGVIVLKLLHLTFSFLISQFSIIQTLPPLDSVGLCLVLHTSVAPRPRTHRACRCAQRPPDFHGIKRQPGNALAFGFDSTPRHGPWRRTFRQPNNALEPQLIASQSPLGHARLFSFIHLLVEANSEHLC